MFALLLGMPTLLFMPTASAGPAVFELRAGADARTGPADEGPARPYLCGELSPHARVGIEACGNGAGVLQQDDQSDMAHFRLRFAAAERRVDKVEGALVLGAGWAEVQRGADAPGFRFGEAQAGQVEAAGGEASVSLRGRYWVRERAHGTVDLSAGAALIPGAPEVIGSEGPVVPFGSLTAGVGF